MSEDHVGAQGSPGANPAAAGGSQIGAATELLRFWLTVSGWFVIAMGAVTVYWSLSFLRADIPFWLVLGPILVGASYVLAGYGLTQQQGWPVPLAMMACILSPLGWMLGGGLLPIAFGIWWVTRQLLQAQAIDVTTDSTASLACGLWVAGITVFLMVIGSA